MMELVERVMCIPAAAFHGLPDLDGFQPGSQLWLGQLLRTSYVAFRDRTKPPDPGALESDLAWVQVVAYVVVRHRGDVLVYRRAGGSDPRLGSLLSVGVGGHVEDRDCEGHSSPYYQGALRRAALRELEEELGLREDRLADLRPVGLVRDATPVGRHHLGVVYIADLSDRILGHPSASHPIVGWANPTLLAAWAPRMEGWSRILVEQLLARDLTNPA